MKKIISCLFAVILCISCFASTAAFADEERQSPSDFVKDFMTDYYDYIFMGVSHDIGRHFSDMMSGADFEKMLAAAKKDGDTFKENQSKFKYSSDKRYDEHTVEEIVTSFPSYFRKSMITYRYWKIAIPREKFGYVVFIDNETKGADGLVYVDVSVNSSWEYYGEMEESGGTSGYYIALYDNGSEYYICDMSQEQGVSDVDRYKFEDFDSIRVILDYDKSAIYPDKIVSWPITEFEKVSETVDTKEPVESEPTDSGATEPVQEKGAGEDAPLPTAALVTIIGTAVIICLIIALCVILCRNGKENGKAE